MRARRVAQRLAKMNDRSIKFALPGQSIAEIVMGLGVARMDAQGFMKLLHGFSQPTLSCQRVAKIMMAIGVQGIDLQNLAKLYNRFVEPILLSQGHP